MQGFEVYLAQDQMSPLVDQNTLSVLLLCWKALIRSTLDLVFFNCYYLHKFHNKQQINFQNFNCLPLWLPRYTPMTEYRQKDRQTQTEMTGVGLVIGYRLAPIWYGTPKPLSYKALKNSQYQYIEIPKLYPNSVIRHVQLYINMQFPASTKASSTLASA